MAYKLIGSMRSPFVRAIRILMTANKIAFDFRVLNFVDDEKAAAEVSSETPINKVPVLILQDGRKVFDSRVIFNFLTEKHNLSRLSLEEENIATSIYSCLDTAVLTFLLRGAGVNLEQKGFFFDRHRARIASNLDFLKPFVLSSLKSGEWKYPQMLLYSFLYYSEKRIGLNFDDRPELHEFLAKFVAAPGVSETTF